MKNLAAMPHLFTPAGQSALAATLQRRPLLAFDFDGTLAPIVARPGDARISPVVAERLRCLAELLPVAIVTGRAVADVRERLGFAPHYIMGSHGAEDGLDSNGAMAHVCALNPVRKLLHAHDAELAEAGVVVEDKRQSVALHYRLSHDRARAQALIHALLAQPDLPVQVFAGKMVVNVTASDAPDKADAVQALVARSGASCAVFAGDDVNDEPVFVSAPPDWLTVRIGRDDPASRARFSLDSPEEMALLLERMLHWLSLYGADAPPENER